MSSACPRALHRDRERVPAAGGDREHVRAGGLEKPVTGLTGFWVLIPLVGWIIWVVKVQNAMNDRWEASGGTHV